MDCSSIANRTRPDMPVSALLLRSCQPYRASGTGALLRAHLFYWRAESRATKTYRVFTLAAIRSILLLYLGLWPYRQRAGRQITDR